MPTRQFKNTYTKPTTQVNPTTTTQNADAAKMDQFASSAITLLWLGPLLPW